VLAEVLTDGDSSRLRQRLVQGDRIVTSLSGYLGFMGDPFDVRDPTALLLSAHHPQGVAVDRVIAGIDEELRRLADDGLVAGELARVQAKIAAHALRGVDSVLGRTLAMATAEQQRGRAELVGELPGLIAAVDGAAVVAAAARLVPPRRAVLELAAGGAQ
jgi:zinc protease